MAKKYTPELKYEIFGKKNWKETHLHFKNVMGASFCRKASVEDGDWKRLIKPDDIPTCKDCMKSFIVHLRCDLANLLKEMGKI